ncbi:MAG: type IV secretory system conjugative DNA transfer family protein [Candidatus Baltobacteraceae bacterium]
MAKQVAAPKDGRGAFLALLVAVAIFLAMLSFETQSIARRAGYAPALGQPVIGKIYAPWASYGWMFTYDEQLNLEGPFIGQPWVLPRPNEPAALREIFTAERGRLPWEAGGAVALFIVLALWWTRDRKNSDLHGAAGWASARDIRRSALSHAEHGIVLGQRKALFGRPGRLLVHNDTQNVLALGPPGEGKTDGIARPTLVKTWLYRSAIIFDPADELTGLTAHVRATTTRVRIFDPRAQIEEPSLTSTVQHILEGKPRYARFNPLAGIAVGDVDSVRAVLASYFFDRDVSEMSSDARFFESRALALATAVVSHVIELGSPTLEAAARYVVDPAWTSDAEMCESLAKSQIRYVQETGAEFARMTDKQRSPFVASLNDRLELFRSPDVARATGASDVAPADLRREATTLYLVVREKDQASLNPLMRMVLTRFLHDLTARLPQEGEQRILLMIDEFPLLRAPIIAQQLATMRKYWIHAVLLAQSLAQIRDTYGANETVSGMCDVRVFFPSVDTATQQLASDTCGQSTRWAESMHRDSAGKSAYATSEAGRPLLYPHELADMKARGDIIVYKKGESPIKARPVRAHADPRFSEVR